MLGDQIARAAQFDGALLASQQAQHSLGGPVAQVTRGDKPLAVLSTELVQHLNQHREADGGVKIAFRDVQAKAFDDQRKADHHQEAKAQDHHCRML